MLSLRTAARMACALALAATMTPPAARAAETVDAAGWICTTEPPAALPAAGAARAKARAFRPIATFDAAGRLTVRFGAPVSAGVWRARYGSAPAAKSTCPTIGFVDQSTKTGQRYRYALTSPDRASTMITVGDHLPATTNRGRVVLIVDETLAESISWALDAYYIPALEQDGWRVVKQYVSPSATPQSIRAGLAQRVAEDPQTTTAFLIGRIPIVLTGSDGGAGARPSDVFYADVDGTWTDSTVNLPNPATADRRNVAGDGRFDQDAAPSAVELAVGRLDTSNLAGVTRDGQPLAADSDEIASYLLRSADSRFFDPGDLRAETFVIDDGDPAASAGTAGWHAASALGGVARAGSRPELDAAAAGDRTTRPTLLFQHGRGTASSLGSWAGTTPGDIASPADAGRGRFIISAGAGVREWHRADALSRAMLTTWSGAEAATADSLDGDGLALGDSLGSSFRTGITETLRGGDPLGSLMGDPTLTGQAAGYSDTPTAKVAAGCTDTSVSFSVLGLPSAATVTADLYRSIDGGAFQLVRRDVSAAWSASTEEFRGTVTDAGILTASPNATVTYEVRPRALHTTGRGSYYVNAPTVRTAALRLRCPWTCDTPTSALPTNSVERSRSAQLESRTTFTDGGRTAHITLDRRHTGRTLTGQRTDEADVPTAEACATGQAAAAYKATGLAPGAISEFVLRESPSGATVPVLIGNELPARYDRGRIIVAVESTLAASGPMQGPMQAYQQSLEADGYEVVLVHVPSTDSVAAVRSRLKRLYDLSPTRTKTAVLIGHVPVPYSGTGVYDGHSEHNGAWSTDAPYADLNGTWTDTTVNITTSSRTQNRNVPGDGKYDQNTLPSRAELAVGRIDFSNMPALGSSEAQLTAAYLQRDLQYRGGQLTFKPEAFTKDNFNFVPAGVLANVSPVVGAANVRVNRSVADARADAATGGPYLFAQASGPGWYTSSQNVGTTTSPVPALFLGSLGSYYGDWDSTDNFLRGHLSQGLGALWEHWAVDGMALGESVGDTVRRHMDSGYKQVRNPLNSYLGDPTLRAYPMRPVTDLWASDPGGCQSTTLSWSRSSDSTVDGYAIERLYPDGWHLLTPTPLPRTAESYEDVLERSFYSPPTYRVRTVRRESTSRGSFTNLGQGAIAYAPVCD